MKEKQNSYTAEEFRREIDNKHADNVCTMIRANILEEMNNTELKEIFRSLMTLRSQEVIDLLAKKSHYFPIEMLDIEIRNHNDKDFVSYVLEKHGKKYRYKTAENANRLFEVACRSECTPMLMFLLKKGLAEGQYPLLISGSEKLFEVLDQIKVTGLHPDTVVTFFMEAATSCDPEKRISELIALGFNIAAVNSEGMNACETLKLGIENYNYGKDKQSQIMKERDIQGLKTLERIYRSQTA